MATKVQAEQRPGRRPSLNPDHTAALRAITQERPRSSLDEVRRELFRKTRNSPCGKRSLPGASSCRPSDGL